MESVVSYFWGLWEVIFLMSEGMLRVTAAIKLANNVSRSGLFGAVQ